MSKFDFTTLERDSVVKTVGGEEFRLVCMDAPGEYPIIATRVVKRTTALCMRAFMRSGRYSPEGTSTLDLVPPTPKIKQWLIVRQTHRGYPVVNEVQYSKKAALHHARLTARCLPAGTKIAVVPIEVDFQWGDGLEDNDDK